MIKSQIEKLWFSFYLILKKQKVGPTNNVFLPKTIPNVWRNKLQISFFVADPQTKENLNKKPADHQNPNATQMNIYM